MSVMFGFFLFLVFFGVAFGLIMWAWPKKHRDADDPDVRYRDLGGRYGKF